MEKGEEGTERGNEKGKLGRGNFAKFRNVYVSVHNSENKAPLVLKI